MLLSRQKTQADIEWMEYELERYRDEDRRRVDEAIEQRREREQERRERAYYEYRTADTWPEALQKQAGLFASEANEAGEFDLDNYFHDGAAACERALEIWQEVKISRQEQVAELERQLAAIQDDIRLEVAQKLDSESDNRRGWRSVASAIENDEDLICWLQW